MKTKQNKTDDLYDEFIGKKNTISFFNFAY